MNTLDSVRKPPVAKCMGIEIECLIERHVHRALIDTHREFFFFGSDGSIDDDWRNGFHGVEMVSQPLPKDWLKKQTRKVFALLDKEKAGMTSNRSCGIHVHVSKKWFSDAKAKSVFQVLDSLSSGDLCHIFGRYKNTYTDEPFGCRYSLVNVTNKHTNEFRMFASSANLQWALYCIDCAAYMVEHANHLSADGLRAFRDCYTNI
jgi:hypothetical protein